LAAVSDKETKQLASGTQSLVINVITLWVIWATTICRPLHVVTWTVTQSFHVGGQRACWWCATS